MAARPFTCRWAALSLSTIASVFIPDIQLPREESETIRHKLVAVSTTGSEKRAHAWFEENKVVDSSLVKIYHDWEIMLEEADFDVVYISTPHPLHYQHVRHALERKRHVLVEKPATMNAAQYERLAELAREQGVVLMEAMWTRYLPAARYFRKELLPHIGEVRRVYADFSFPIVSPELPHSSRFLDKAAGAGSLLDQGVYALNWADLALHGSDDASAVTKVVHAHTMSVPEVPGEVDDIDTVLLSKRDRNSTTQRAVGIVTTSMTLPGSCKPAFYQRLQASKSAPSVRIEATKASVAIPFPPIRPQELHVQWYGEEYLDESGIETEKKIHRPVERGWGLWYQADVIAARIVQREAGAEGEVIGFEESMRVLRWMDEARKQAGISYDAELDQL
jgi:predicted dehydrogenase